MNVAQLAKLNRVLRDVLMLASSEKDRSVSPGQVAIFEDIYKHSPTTIQDITRRTELAQSFVSKTIARMKQRGVVKVRQSQADKRKSILTFNPELSGFVQAMSERSIYEALAQYFPDAGEDTIARIDVLLNEVCELLVIDGKS